MMKRILLALALIAIFVGPAVSGCSKRNEVKHSDYGYCERSGKHRHNDHIFIGDFHDHSLCEWSKFE